MGQCEDFGGFPLIMTELRGSGEPGVGGVWRGTLSVYLCVCPKSAVLGMLVRNATDPQSWVLASPCQNVGAQAQLGVATAHGGDLGGGKTEGKGILL